MTTLTLTIDNGPDPDATPRVLDILAARNIPAIFFVVGRHAADPARRHLMERAHNEGHWIGNHTWSHDGPIGTLEGPDAVAEIARTQDAIGDLAHPHKWFRPVGGGGALGPHLLNSAARDHLVAGGYSCVLWNSVPGDFSDPDGWVDRGLADVDRLDRVLMVLHDIAAGCVDKLDRFLGMLEDRGVAFVQDIPDDAIIIDRGNVRDVAAAYVMEA
jgi:peptidoglycan/xylan/chitin deacetylase (PgdA/CDA1 family)